MGTVSVGGNSVVNYYEPVNLLVKLKNGQQYAVGCVVVNDNPYDLVLGNSFLFEHNAYPIKADMRVKIDNTFVLFHMFANSKKPLCTMSMHVQNATVADKIVILRK
jgi:hypothetical protein